MFQPLPFQTLTESLREARRKTAVLFAVLCLIYIVFSHLMAAAVIVSVDPTLLFDLVRLIKENKRDILTHWAPLISAFAIGAAAVHFWIVRGRRLETIMTLMGGQAPDDRDDIHKRFCNIVEEVQLAVGIRPIRPFVIPTLGTNAFSIEDGAGQCAIGITEGLLAKLDRSELAAVVAHEAAHLAHGDTRLATLAATLFMVFRLVRQQMREWLKGVQSGGGRTTMAYFLLSIISVIGEFTGRIVYCVISREREHYADADAAYMTKDPLSLAGALYKIAGSYRGSDEIPSGLSALFILNPQSSRLDERRDFWSDIFSTHPPVSERLDRLLSWAKTDVSRLQAMAAESAAHTTPAAQTPQNLYYVRGDLRWDGPYTIPQLQALGTLNPADWICPMGTENVCKASEEPALTPMFDRRIRRGRSSKTCPRCQVRLVERRYEGAQVLHCAFCLGYLLNAGVLERIISRREQGFTSKEIEEAKSWRLRRRGREQPIDGLPLILCPACGGKMFKTLHGLMTAVVIDRCGTPSCRAVWCDGGDMEKIQILVENPMS